MKKNVSRPATAFLVTDDFSESASENETKIGFLVLMFLKDEIGWVGSLRQNDVAGRRVPENIAVSVHVGVHYSVRNASIGFTMLARRAGK